jgi:hypothetical protein
MVNSNVSQLKILKFLLSVCPLCLQLRDWDKKSTNETTGRLDVRRSGGSHERRHKSTSAGLNGVSYSHHSNKDTTCSSRRSSHCRHLSYNSTIIANIISLRRTSWLHQHLIMAVTPELSIRCWELYPPCEWTNRCVGHLSRSWRRTHPTKMIIVCFSPKDDHDPAVLSPNFSSHFVPFHSIPSNPILL